MNKICGKCKISKDTEEFHRRGSGFKSWCKVCTKEYDRLYQETNRTNRAPIRKAYRAAFSNWFLDLKRDIPCVMCGKILHPVAMDWHHTDPQTKSFAVSNLTKQGSKKKILEEIAKCELVCVVCHRIHSYEQQLAG